MADDIMSVIEEAIQQYAPGGQFAQARETQLSKTRTSTTGKMYSNLIKSGLSGVETMSGVPQQFETEVGQPYGIETELLRTGKLMEAILAKSGILQHSQDVATSVSEAQKDRDAAQKIAEDRNRVAAQASARSSAAANYKPTSSLIGGVGSYVTGGDTGSYKAGPTQHLGALTKGMTQAGSNGATNGGFYASEGEMSGSAQGGYSGGGAGEGEWDKVTVPYGEGVPGGIWIEGTPGMAQTYLVKKKAAGDSEDRPNTYWSGGIEYGLMGPTGRTKG
ncbi:MAG: hypothetical protein IMZ53_02935 [Thermoplasmata archaeon]|nr:hypothetical protein [Thermoplasmata archaeon]